MSPTVETISGTKCTWTVSDRDGFQYPHGIPARHRVSNASEFCNGDFCARHAKLAVALSIARAEENEKD